jgi:hypothetical protein
MTSFLHLPPRSIIWDATSWQEWNINSDVRIEKAVHMHGFFFLRNKSIMKKMFFIIDI